MNREDTKAAIEVMQAYVDGEEIEGRSKHKFTSNKWSTSKIPTWFFLEREYRVKVEPREFYLHGNDNRRDGGWSVVPPGAACSGMIKVREVTD